MDTDGGVGRESLELFCRVYPLHRHRTLLLSVVLGGLLRAGALHAGGGPVEFSVEVSWNCGGLLHLAACE